MLLGFINVYFTSTLSSRISPSSLPLPRVNDSGVPLSLALWETWTHISCSHFIHRISLSRSHFCFPFLLSPRIEFYMLFPSIHITLTVFKFSISFCLFVFFFSRVASRRRYERRAFLEPKSVRKYIVIPDTKRNTTHLSLC